MNEDVWKKRKQAALVRAAQSLETLAEQATEARQEFVSTGFLDLSLVRICHKLTQSAIRDLKIAGRQR